MRLDKFLAQNGIGSRSDVKELIKKGRITVNKQIIKSPDAKITDTDIIMLDNKEISAAKTRYYMLNKPAGVVSATKDNLDRTVIDILKDAGIPIKDLFPVGRLDKDTEGLLILTQDGALAHNLLSPKKHIDKTYYVQCAVPLNEDMKIALEEGVDIGDDKKTLKSIVKILSEKEMELTIQEGRFHQIKRMLHAVNNEVIYLKRISMGKLCLDYSLNTGEFRELTDSEVELLKNCERKSF